MPDLLKKRLLHVHLYHLREGGGGLRVSVVGIKSYNLLLLITKENLNPEKWHLQAKP